MSVEEIRDRVRGVLVGLTAGDRNGGPIRMAVKLAESLIERQQFDPDDLLNRYLGWWWAGAFDTGPTTAEVLSLVDAGVPNPEAVERVHEASGGLTAGCNPAHRCPPLALAAPLPDEELAAYALREARLTHGDPLAGDVAAAVVALCRGLIRGLPWEVALDRAKRGRSPKTIRALDIDNRAPLNPGGFAPEVLRAAVHFVAGAGTFEGCLTESLAFAGPANYSPVLVGTIGAARWGASSIPAKMLAHCEVLPRVVQAAEALAQGWM
jgi:ADP-ribosyl-[dinitrogen reductase] hydrolase